MNPDPFTKELKDHEESFREDPTMNWLEAMHDNVELIREIDDLKQHAMLNKTCINALNSKIEELETELATPWYIKLWNSIPRFSLSIRRTN